VAIIPALPGAVTGYRADLTTVPLDGVEPGQVAVATRAGERNRLVAAFRKYAEVLLRPPERVMPRHLDRAPRHPLWTDGSTGRGGRPGRRSRGLPRSLPLDGFLFALQFGVPGS
jgi:hypothetical protein